MQKLKVLSQILILFAIITISQQQSTKVRVTNGVSDSSTVYFCFQAANGDTSSDVSFELDYTDISPYFYLNGTNEWNVGVYSAPDCKFEELIVKETLTTDPTNKYTISFVGLLSTNPSLVFYTNYLAPTPLSGNCQINLYFQSENTTSVTLALFTEELPNQSAFMEENTVLYSSSGYKLSNNLGFMLTQMMYEFTVKDSSISGVSVHSNYTFVDRQSYSVFAWGLLTHDDFDSLHYAFVLDDADGYVDDNDDGDIYENNDDSGSSLSSWILIAIAFGILVLVFFSCCLLLVVVIIIAIVIIRRKRTQKYESLF